MYVANINLLHKLKTESRIDYALKMETKSILRSYFRNKYINQCNDISVVSLAKIKSVLQVSLLPDVPIDST